MVTMLMNSTLFLIALVFFALSLREVITRLFNIYENKKHYEFELKKKNLMQDVALLKLLEETQNKVSLLEKNLESIQTRLSLTARR